MSWDRDDVADSFPRQAEAFRAALDEPLPARDPSMLLQVVRDLGLRPDAVVLDVGCGDGWHAFRLATHFGARVLGVEPAQARLDAAREARRDQPEEIASRVSFERGSAGRLPVAAGSVDLVWCREVLPHVEDVTGAYAEFARVLRPGGHVVAHQAVTTDLLARARAAWMLEVLAMVPASLDPAVLDGAVARSGLQVVETVDLDSEWAEWAEQDAGRATRALRHLARLRRDPVRYRAAFGAAAYDLLLADCLWQVERMSGGLVGRLDVLRRP